MIVNFCFTNIYATTMRVVNKIVTLEIFIYALIGIIGCMIGDCIGKVVFDKLDSQKMKLVIYIGMLISGVIMIV